MCLLTLCKGDVAVNHITMTNYHSAVLETDGMKVSLEVAFPFKGIYTASVKSIYTRVKDIGELLGRATRPTPAFKRMTVEVNTEP